MKKLLRAFKRWNAASVARIGSMTAGARGRGDGKISPSRVRADPRDEEIVWVPPASIHFKLLSKTIIALRSDDPPPDDWDLNRRRIEETAKLRSVMQHFRDGIDWENTEIFRRYAIRLARAEVIRGCRSIDELKKVYQADMDKLYDSLRRDGFLSHQARGKKSSDLPHVYVARDGEILFGAQGNHRLAIAKLLKLDKIACRVLVRHTDWQKFRGRLAKIEANARRKTLNAALVDHPDLQDFLCPGTGNSGD